MSVRVRSPSGAQKNIVQRNLYRTTGFAIRLFVYIPADYKSAGTKAAEKKAAEKKAAEKKSAEKKSAGTKPGLRQEVSSREWR